MDFDLEPGFFTIRIWGTKWYFALHLRMEFDAILWRGVEWPMD